MLDLKRMNRILEVNEEIGYALVEPGVSYFDLYEHIQAKGYKLWLDVPDPGWGSVVGNALDHGVGYTPYGDHFVMQCGMEVVLPNGELVRTGMGAMPGNTTWQLFKYGFGPYLDGMFTQSNFGIVTKMGIWLMPEPPGYRPYMISFQREEDLEQVVDILRPLKVSIGDPECGDDPQPAAGRRDESRRAASTPTSAGRSRTARRARSWPTRTSACGISTARCTDRRRHGHALDRHPRFLRQDARREVLLPRGPQAAERPADRTAPTTMRGIPRMNEFSFINWAGGGGHIGFSPVSPIRGAEAMKQYRMVRDRLHEYGFDYISMFAIGWRELHHVVELLFDKTQPATSAEAEDVFALLVREAAAAGYGEYRTHISFMDDIAATYGWNDNALLKLHQTIKDALDPKGILAPGKSGIWPARYRRSHT